MSSYGDFIEKIIKDEYKLISVFKNDETTQIELFSHKQKGNKVIKILSKNRNDHIFRKLRGLKNDHLPAIFEVCSCEGHLLVLEEFIEGETLEEVLSKAEFSEKNAINCILDICDTLNFLHKNRIIHRDIKPSNVIITPEGKAVLIDFSASRSINDEKEQDTTNLGTVGYAAPEQFGISQSAAPTDIYALGVMFNEMLINAHPSIKIPRGRLGKIIKKCTETQISERYQNIDALISDLKRYKKFKI